MIHHLTIRYIFLSSIIISSTASTADIWPSPPPSIQEPVISDPQVSPVTSASPIGSNPLQPSPIAAGPSESLVLKNEVHFFGGIAIFGNLKSSSGTTTLSTGIDASPLAGIEVDHSILPHFSVGTILSWIRFKEANNANYRGDDLFSFYIQPRVHWTEYERFISWFGLGVGVSATFLAVDKVGSASFSSPAWGFTFRPTLGFDFLVTDSFLVGLGASFNYFQTSFSGTVSGKSVSTDTSRWYLGNELRMGAFF